MTNKTKRIIIIGNGIAGLSAAEAARKKDSSVEIMIISNEKYLTYYRTRIAELFDAEVDHSTITMRKEEWYAERHIKLLLQKTVKSINTASKVILVQDDVSDTLEEIQYDKLVITTGARCFMPNIPGIYGDNVFVLRSLDDAIRIADKLKNIKNAVVVGGGLLGLECAYDFCKKGINTLIVERLDRLLPNQLDQDGSELFEGKILSLGINILKGVSIEKIEDKSDSGIDIQNYKSKINNIKKIITLNSGEKLETDLILFSAGACPNKELVNGTNIITNHAIEVNKFMQTNIEDVYAAGDAAQFNGKWYGLWSVALSQGKVTGNNVAASIVEDTNANILNEFVEYTPQIPPYFLNSMGTRVSSIGDIGRDKAKEYSTEKIVNNENHTYEKLYFVDGKIVGSILVGDTKKATFLGKAIEAKMTKEEMKEVK